MANDKPETPALTESRDVSTVLVNTVDGMEIPIWPVGTWLDGRYEVEEVRGGLGRSGMGIVYIVTDGEQRFAVKTFQRRFSYELPFIQRFIREARTWMLLGFHPNIVRAYQLDIIHAAPYLFMEFVDSDIQGRYSTADYLRCGLLPLSLALHFSIQFCDGMIHATQAVPGLVHRDIKPENLLVTPEHVLKISDFGLVRCKAMAADPLLKRAELNGRLDEPQLTQAGSVFGTPAYMAPEQFEAADEVTMSADVYAFACCLYEWLTTVPPFEVSADTSMGKFAEFQRKHQIEKPAALRERWPECPRPLNDLVMKCLEKDPEHRIQDYQELRAQLQQVYARTTDSTDEPTPIVHPSAREVAVQTRSLTLLDGYDQAIRMRNLREGQDTSPYAFHLALASFFHCQKDSGEERRQLEKAERARGGESGYEVVYRLGELLIVQGDLSAAEQLIRGFLEREPSAMDQILETQTHLLAAQGRYDEALGILDRSVESLRIKLVRSLVLKRAGRSSELILVLKSIIEESLDRFEDKIAQLEPEDRVGWAEEGDAEMLQDVLALLRPSLDTEILNVVEGAIWPDLSGYPDFGADMAWLSHALGELASLEGPLPPGDRQNALDCAGLLEYPERAKRQRERDEYWFWLQDASNTA